MRSEKLDIKKIENTYSSKFLNMYKTSYQDKNKKDKEWFFASRLDEKTLLKSYQDGHKTPDAVVIAPYHEELKKLILIKQYRIPVDDYVYEIPAGLVDDGENSKNTLKRELKEETGLELIDIKYLSKNIYTSPGMTDENFDMYYVTCTGEITTEYNEGSEDITICPVDKDEAKKLLLSDNKLDSKTIIAIQRYLLDEELFE